MKCNIIKWKKYKEIKKNIHRKKNKTQNIDVYHLKLQTNEFSEMNANNKAKTSSPRIRSSENNLHIAKQTYLDTIWAPSSRFAHASLQSMLRDFNQVFIYSLGLCRFSSPWKIVLGWFLFPASAVVRWKDLMFWCFESQFSISIIFIIFNTSSDVKWSILKLMRGWDVFLYYGTTSNNMNTINGMRKVDLPGYSGKWYT